MTPQAVEQIGVALRAIASACDGARSRDGGGFSKFDKEFGLRLAGTPTAHWTPRMTQAAHKLALKYRRQLDAFGIVVDPTLFDHGQGKGPQRSIGYDGANFIVKCDRIPAIIDTIKRMPGALATGDGWLVPFSQSVKPALKHLADTHGFKLEPQIARALGAVTAQAQVSTTDRIVDVHPDEAGALVMTFTYRFELAIEAQAHAAWQAAKNRWRVPILIPEKVREFLRFAQGFSFTVTPAAQARIVAVLAKREASIAASSRAEALEELAIEGLTATLRPFQISGVQYAAEEKRVIIADQPGLGKTIQAIGTVLKAKAFPALVIPPASLKINWLRELRKFAPGCSVDVMVGTRPRFSSGDFVICNYDILGAQLDALKLRKFQTIVLDEAHYIKNREAQRTEWALAAAVGTEYRLLLTGTPVLNSGREIENLIGLLERFADFGGYGYFKRKYRNKKNLVELNTALRATCYIRRLKKDVLKELPEKQRTHVPVEITNRKEYELAELQLMSWIRQQVDRDKAFLESIAHLTDLEREAAIAKRKADKVRKAERAETLVRMEALKQCVVRGKMDPFRKWLDDFLLSGEKLVIFGVHTETINQIAQAYDWPTITGSDAAEEKEAAKDRFQNDPNLKGIVCNIRAGGVGHTLTAASNVAFIELGWTPADHDQAEDRIHRIGQRDGCMAWYFLGYDTIDEWLAASLDEKRTEVNAVTDGIDVEVSESSVFGAVLERLRKGRPAA